MSARTRGFDALLLFIVLTVIAIVLLVAVLVVTLDTSGGAR